MKHSIDELKYLQALPLELKIQATKQRIREWYDYYGGDVYVAFSGGKDSTVLLDLARQVNPNIKGMFVNTGLEYLEIQKFVKTYDNIDIIRPKISFVDVIKKYGYPFISKEVSNVVSQARLSLASGGKYNTYRLQRLNGTLTTKDGQKSKFNCAKWKPLLDVDFNISDKCCNVMKKEPAHRYAKENHLQQITGQTTEESKLRLQKWLQNGCNGFDMKTPISNPMSFWTEQDILRYIHEHNLPIASVYGDIEQECDLLGNCQYKCSGVKRTGCVACGYGTHLESGEGRYVMLKQTHPRLYDYCMGGGVL